MTDMEEFKELKPVNEAELTQLFGIHRITLYRLRRKGKLPYYRLGSKIYYLPHEVFACLRRPKEKPQTKYQQALA